MDLSSVIGQMHAAVRSTASAVAFAKGRLAYDELRSFESSEELMASLTERNAVLAVSRDKLTRRVIALHRSSRDGLWSSIMFSLYSPFLERLRISLVSGKVDGNDLDQLVLEGFLVTLNKLNLDAFRNVTFGIVQRTRCEVFRVLRHELKREKVEMLAPEFDYVARVPRVLAQNWGPHGGSNGCFRSSVVKGESPSYVTTSSVVRSNDAEEATVEIVSLAQLMLRAGSGEVSLSALEVIASTQDESLRDRCSRLGCTERDYQRQKKQRSRAMDKLRTMAKQGE